MKKWGILLILALLLCLGGCAQRWESPTASTGAVQTGETPPASQTASTPPETTQLPASTPPQTELTPEPADSDFVRIRDYLPQAKVELFYATENNFTGQRIYGFTEPYLRYGTVKKLQLVQKDLAQKGLYLKIWDGFRPTAAQFKLWDIFPDPTYVSDPNKGFSSHSRGNTVDLTLVCADGTEVRMPTSFDDFSALADRDYSDCPTEAAENARLLEKTMEKYGFRPYFGEWWHFSDVDSYPVEQAFQPSE